MIKLLPQYIEYLYHEYDFINFNAPRQVGKSTSFYKTIVNDLLVEKKVAYIFFISKKYSISFFGDKYYNNYKKEIIEKQKDYIVFKNGSILFFKTIKYLFNPGQIINSDIYYFDSIYDSLKIEILNYMNLNSKIIFNDCLFNWHIIKKLNEISNKKFEDINIDENNNINLLLREQKIKKIQNQLSYF